MVHGQELADDLWTAICDMLQFELLTAIWDMLQFELLTAIC